MLEREELLQRGAATARNRRPRAEESLHQKRRRDRADDDPERREEPAEEARERGGINLPRRQVVGRGEIVRIGREQVVSDQLGDREADGPREDRERLLHVACRKLRLRGDHVERQRDRQKQVAEKFQHELQDEKRQLEQTPDEHHELGRSVEKRLVNRLADPPQAELGAAAADRLAQARRGPHRVLRVAFLHGVGDRQKNPLGEAEPIR